MIYLDLPNINTGGTVEQQLSEICSYIYKNNEQMNATLANLTTEKIWEKTASALSSAENKDETPQLLSQYAKTRSLILKTAEEIAKTDEHYSMLLSGSYLAKSQFGEYLLNTSVEVDGNSTGFTELYNYAGQIDTDFSNYRLDESMYIRRGLLDNSGATPVYGIELGILEKTLSVDGEEIDLTETYRTRITPDKWSFLYNGSDGQDCEVAYIQADAINFPKANIRGGSITGGSININNKFKVNSSGEVTSLSADFAKNVSGTYYHLKLDSSDLSISFLEEDKENLAIDMNGIHFYKRANGVDHVLGEIKRLNYSANHWGLCIRLLDDYASFFAIRDNNGTALAVIPRGRPAGEAGNLFNSQGIHINSPTDFHSNAIKDVNIIGTLQSDGKDGKTEDVTVMISGGGTKILHIRNGIITTS